MRDLTSHLDRVIRCLFGVRSARSTGRSTGRRGNHERFEKTPSAVVASIVVFLRNLLLLTALGGGAYWICLQDWSIDGRLDSAGAIDASQSSRHASVLDLSWSADGRTVISRSVGQFNNGSLLLLHRFADDNAPAFFTTRPVAAYNRFICRAALLPDASAAIVVDECCRVSRIEAESGTTTPLLELSAMVEDIPVLAVAPNGLSFCVALGRELRLCDPLTGHERQRLVDVSSSASEIIFSDDGLSIAAGHADGTIRVWNRVTGEVACDLMGHAGAVGAVRFVNGSRQLASVGAQGDDTLRLWDLETGERLWQVQCGQLGLHALAISTDGRLAVTGGADYEVVVWDLSARHRLRSISGHTGTIRGLQFSSDGTMIASASSDGTIRLWDCDTAELLFLSDVGSMGDAVRPIGDGERITD